MRMTLETHDRTRCATAVLALVAIVLAPWAEAQEPQTLFETSLIVEEMSGKQAVIEINRGEFIIDLLADTAPNHVGHFIKSAEDGVYDDTIFHRMIRHGVVQGGDPFTKDPEKSELYGQGGLGVLAAEISDDKHTRGAVSAVQVPGDPDSAGTQCFICVVDQPGLDGAHTVFGRASEGMNLVTEISEAETDADGRAVERITIRSVTIRDKPPPQPAPLVIGLLAMGLTAVGIYGVRAYLVTRRTREFGVRVALGAQARDVLGLVLRQGLGAAGIGIGVGLMGAIAVTRLLESQLFEVTATDPLTFVGVATILTLVTLVASYLPARRATKIDPMVSLRIE